MRLSRNYTVDDWNALDFKSEVDWELAAEMLKDRFETRYLEHIRALLTRQTSGFVVLALDCTLMETLHHFRLGLKRTPRRKATEYFIKFLLTPPFAEFFNQESAKTFYDTIRCGLLHQSEAGENSRVKRGTGLALVAYTANHKGLIINTKAVHELLEKAINDYLEQLRNPNSTEARAAFRKKMDFICRVEEQPPANPDV